MDFTFETVDMKTELQKALKAQLPKFGFSNVMVLKADPAKPAEIPCVAINRINDNESEQSIADAVGTSYDKESETHYEFFGSFFSEAVEIRVWHTNADERDRLNRHVKAILFALRKYLVELGVLNITLRAGMDEQDTSMQQAPMALYWASYTMTYLNPLDVTFQEHVPAITSIDVNHLPITDSASSTTVTKGISGAVTTGKNP